ncbi:MAG: hypothetical protein HOM24_04410 [Flavobacteriales bacterium]|nr:hypothetical protein [Flavobacteriales bacterium]
MRFSLKILSICIIASSCFSCKDTNTQNKKEVTNYPNQDSQLALLMREMTNEMEIIKSQILNGEELSSSVKIEKVYTDIPTDPYVRDNNWFLPMTDQYIFAVNDLLNNPVNRKDQYNTIVQSCINCHNQVCQGPIKRIKKLRIKK